MSKPLLTVRQYKDLAKARHDAARRAGTRIPLGNVQEAIAREWGYRSWGAMRAAAVEAVASAFERQFAPLTPEEEAALQEWEDSWKGGDDRALEPYDLEPDADWVLERHQDPRANERPDDEDEDEVEPMPDGSGISDPQQRFVHTNGDECPCCHATRHDGSVSFEGDWTSETSLDGKYAVCTRFSCRQCGAQWDKLYKVDSVWLFPHDNRQDHEAGLVADMLRDDGQCACPSCRTPLGLGSHGAQRLDPKTITTRAYCSSCRTQFSEDYRLHGFRLRTTGRRPA